MFKVITSVVSALLLLQATSGFSVQPFNAQQDVATGLKQLDESISKLTGQATFAAGEIIKAQQRAEDEIINANSQINQKYNQAKEGVAKLNEEAKKQGVNIDVCVQAFNNNADRAVNEQPAALDALSDTYADENREYVYKANDDINALKQEVAAIKGAAGACKDENCFAQVLAKVKAAQSKAKAIDVGLVDTTAYIIRQGVKLGKDILTKHSLYVAILDESINSFKECAKSNWH